MNVEKWAMGDVVGERRDVRGRGHGLPWIVEGRTLGRARQSKRRSDSDLDAPFRLPNHIVDAHHVPRLPRQPYVRLHHSRNAPLKKN
jgi:hypothetical protein